MKNSKVACASSLLVMLSFSIEVSAQTPATSFEELQSHIRIGDTVRVSEKSGQQTTGRIEALTPLSLRLAVKGTRHDFEQSAVTRIERRNRDSVRNGVFMGAAAGALIGFLAGKNVHEGPCPPSQECGQASVIGTAGGVVWGGVGGWIADALIHKREVVYQSP
jgi:hypothetical protein